MARAKGPGGLIFGDHLITDRKVFIKRFAKYYMEKQPQDLILIDTAIKILITDITLIELGVRQGHFTSEDDLKEFMSDYKNFQKVVLLNNNDPDLLVTYVDDYNGNSVNVQSRQMNKTTDSFSQISAVNQNLGQGGIQNPVTGQYIDQFGIRAWLKTTKIVSKASQAEQFLRKHLDGLFRRMDQKLSRSEAITLHKWYSPTLAQLYNHGKPGTKNNHLFKAGAKTFNDAFYGDRLSTAHGNIIDAFFQHIANFEPIIFNFLKKPNAYIDYIIFKLYDTHSSVYDEEGCLNQGSHFPELMLKSKNSKAWYAGEDIVIVNDQGELVYNISLKSTHVNSRQNRVFEIKTARLKQALLAFLTVKRSNSQKTAEAKARILYDRFFTTVSNSDILNNMRKTSDDILDALGIPSA